MNGTDLLADAVTQLKEHIHREAQAAVTTFLARTGLTPSAINIHLIDTTNHGERVRRSVVGGVTVDLGRL